MLKLSEKLNIILREMFYVTSGALIIFSVLELIHPKIVLVYVNINYLLIFWLIIGIFILLTKFEKK